jgi:hypothetical protein
MANPFTPRFVDLVRNTSTTVGTGDFALGAAVNGYASFTAALSVGDRFYYSAIGVDKPAEREVGRGTLLAGGIIAREPVSGAKTAFTSGTKSIALVAAGEWFGQAHQLISGLDSDPALAANSDARLATQRAIKAYVDAHGSGASTAMADRAVLALASSQAGMAILREPGREGMFVWDGSNLSAKVTADPNQGVYVAPASDATGASGAWVRKFSGRVNVRWFGAVGDDVTNDGPAFLAALSCINGMGATAGYGYPGRAGVSLLIPAGRYFLGTNTLDIITTMILEGEGVGAEAAQSTVLRWSAGATGIRVQTRSTSGATTSGLSLAYSGEGSIIRNLALIGGYTTTDADFHGIHLRGRATIQDCFIAGFEGEGIYIYAASPTNGNANNWRIERVVVQQCRNGLLTDGPDVNAGHALAVSANSNRQWGIFDSSFLGNTYMACHVAGSGSGAYKTDDINARNVFIGCYSESGQPISSFVNPTLVLGGLHAAGVPGVSWLTADQGLRATANFYVDGNFQAFGNTHTFGPSSGDPAYDTSIYFDSPNFNTTLVFRSWSAGVPQTDAYLIAYRNFGVYFNSRLGFNFQYDGADTAQITATGVNITTGKNLAYNSVPVLAAGVLTAAAMPAFTGDVTSTAGSLALSLSAATVVAKLAGQALAPASVAATGTVTGSNLSGTNTGDETSATVVAKIAGQAAAPASVAATGTVTTSGGSLGYATGAGGAVTQATSKSTGVTLNKSCGKITMSGVALAAAGIAEFTVTNSQVANTDTVILNLASGATTSTAYRYWISAVAGGSFKVCVENRSAGSLSEALVFNFAVIKAVTA